MQIHQTCQSICRRFSDVPAALTSEDHQRCLASVSGGSQVPLRPNKQTNKHGSSCCDPGSSPRGRSDEAEPQGHWFHPSGLRLTRRNETTVSVCTILYKNCQKTLSEKNFPSAAIPCEMDAVFTRLHHLRADFFLLQGLRGSGLDRFPVDQYQNSWHLFRVLETLLQTSKVACRVDGGSEQTGFLGHLKERVFVMSDEFPLFCMYMWRIGGLLTTSDR